MNVVRHTVSLDGLAVVVFDDSVEITIKLGLSFEGDKREMAFSAEENIIKKMGWDIIWSRVLHTFEIFFGVYYTFRLRLHVML